MIALRDYQGRTIDEIRRHYERRPLVALPTGSGKTIIFVEIARRAAEAGHRILILAHRKELILQAVQKLQALGVMCGIVMAGFPEHPDRTVQVASIQTLRNRRVVEPSIIIVDEAHHARAETYLQILDRFPNAHVIGFTATPYRLDGKGLGDVFGEIVIGATIPDLVADGHLMEPVVYAGKEVPDLTGIHTRHGDFVKSELNDRTNQPRLICDIYRAWEELAFDRTTVIFAASVEHSKSIRNQFAEHGVRIAHLDGKTPSDERDAVLRDLAEGGLQVVTNHGILTEGWDLPTASCCILARPTKSDGLYRQMVGRIMRPAPGKPTPLVLDHAGCTERHGFVTYEPAYTLDGVQRRQPTRRGPSITTCEVCYLVVESGTEVCPECGTPLPHREPDIPDPAEGCMVLLEKKETQRTAYRELVTTASRKGYKLGWARHQFKRKFGRWPCLYKVEHEAYTPFGEPLTGEHLQAVCNRLGMDFSAEYFRIQDSRDRITDYVILSTMAAELKQRELVALQCV